MSVDFSGEGFEMVPVPRRLLPEVYRFLGDRMLGATWSSPDTDGVSTPSPDETVASSKPWSAEELTRLYGLLRNRGLQAPIVMLDLAAKRPDEQILFSEVLEVSGLSMGLARQQLAQLTRIANGDFHRANYREKWPLRVQFDGSGKALYSFDDHDVARNWLMVSRDTDTD